MGECMKTGLILITPLVWLILGLVIHQLGGSHEHHIKPSMFVSAVITMAIWGIGLIVRSL